MSADQATMQMRVIGGDSLERMLYAAVDLKRQLAADDQPRPFKIHALGMMDAGFRENRAQALAIRARRAHRDDADSREIVAYLDALL